MQGSKNFSVELFEKLTDETQKHLNIQRKKKRDMDATLNAIQNVAVNYLANITSTLIDNMPDPAHRLNYIECVRDHVNQVLDNLKTQAKTVNLN